MQLPQGFVLEQSTPGGLKLPPGFELETSVGSSGIPGPRRATTFAEGLGRTAASLADVTVGGVLPAAVQTIGYPVLRAFGQSPEQAAASTQRMTEQVGSPFGRAFGVEKTPEYQGEAARRLMEFVGQNIQKGTKWISEQTGVPQQDVDSMAATLTLGAPQAARAMGQGLRVAAESPIGQQVRTGLRMPVEPMLEARRQRRSEESYARGPQIDAIKDAQRLKLALNPTDIQPSVGTRTTAALAGARGEEAIQLANRPRVNEIARGEMGMPPTAQLNDPKTFDAARAAVAAPYEKIKNIPVIQVDDSARAALEALRPSETMIGGEAVAAQLNARIDSALKQVDAGMSGQAFLDNVSKLRKDARRIYRNKNALPEQIDLAETNLAIANILEGAIEKSVFDPKLLAEYRAARQKMAQIYAYEAATDFNTGFVDPGKIARVTAKDNALTGEIASLGRIAGNFPSAFKSQAEAPWYSTKVSRAGFGGAGGAVAGGALGGMFGMGWEGSIVGSALGGVLGELGSRSTAARLASPEYQAGLRVRDFRLPQNQLAPELAPTNALVPYVAPQSILIPGEGAFVTGRPAPTLRQTSEGVYVAPSAPVGQRPAPQAQFVGPQAGPPALPAPSAEATMATLRAEDVRRAGVSRAIGQEAEARQAAAEAAARRPAGGEVMLEIDPATGRMREASQGVRGATPETFQNFGANLQSAAEKVTAGKRFDLTAAEKVAWERTKVDLAEVVPGMKALTDKAIAEKMMDRQWVEAQVSKTKEKIAAFDEIAKRAKDAQARQKAIADRTRLQYDVLAQLEALEERLRGPRPTSAGGQGPKTRAAKSAANRNALTSPSDNSLID